MPIDYNSFMTGVITGLKLGRTKLGRQPPVPSGRYILTESGEKVLTELNSPSLILLGTGEWVDISSPYTQYTGVRLRVSDGEVTQFFGARRGNDYWYVLVSENSFVGKTIYYDKMRTNGTIETREEGPIQDGYYPSQGGNLYMLMFTLDRYEYKVGITGFYIEFSYPEQLIYLVENITNSPMITEGG